MDVVEHYKVDGMHFDYVRLASPDFDYSRTSLKSFRKWLEPQLLPAERRALKKLLPANPLAATEMYPDRFAEFQREQITNLVERIYQGGRNRRPEVIAS